MFVFGSHVGNAFADTFSLSRQSMLAQMHSVIVTKIKAKR